MNTNDQIELNFKTPGTPGCTTVRHERRRHRAQWWFQQMRSAVDRAVDWKPAPQARPEQLHMALPAEGGLFRGW